MSELINQIDAWMETPDYALRSLSIARGLLIKCRAALSGANKSADIESICECLNEIDCKCIDGGGLCVRCLALARAHNLSVAGIRAERAAPSAGVVEALRAFLVKYDEAAPSIDNMFALQFVRSGVQYSGPTYGDELNALREALRQHEAKPLPLPEFDDASVQIVYDLLCDSPQPPNPEEHWEGYLARVIVTALTPPLPDRERALVEAAKPFIEEAKQRDDYLHDTYNPNYQVELHVTIYEIRVLHDALSAYEVKS